MIEIIAIIITIFSMGYVIAVMLIYKSYQFMKIVILVSMIFIPLILLLLLDDKSLSKCEQSFSNGQCIYMLR